MKVCWISASPLATTGYGRVTRAVAPRLMEKHEVVMLGGLGGVNVWGGKMEWNYGNKTADVYPTVGETSGKDTFPELHAKFNFDVAMSLWDLFSIPWLGEISIPAISYVPIDSPMTRRMADYAKNIYKIVAMSKFGERELQRFFPPSRLAYIEHGVDSEVFHPDPRLREIGRRTLKDIHGNPVPENAFIALDVATNIGERKQLPFLIWAFSEFAERHKDAYLFLHTNKRMPHPWGHDLDVYAEEVGLKNLITLPGNPMVDPQPDEILNVIYNLSDVFVNPSMGEGFGLPFLEAMAAGLPCIATNSSSAPELVEGRGWLIATVDDYIDVPNWLPSLQGYHPPRKSSLLACLEEAYNNPELVYKFSRQSRELAITYDWNNVIPKWLKILDEAETDIKILKSIEANIK